MSATTAQPADPARGPTCPGRPVARVGGDRAALAVVVLAAALARSARIPDFEINADEAFSWRITRFPVGELLRRLADDAHPPLHYLALKGWSAAFGDSLASLRGLSVLLSCVTLVGMYRLVALVRAGVSPAAGPAPGDANWCGVLAAALLAVGPLHGDSSVVLRMYAMGSCLSVLNTCLFLSLVRRPRGRRLAWAAYAATTAAFALTHYYASFTLLAPALAVVGLAFGSRGRPPGVSGPELVSRFALAWFAATLLYLPWLPSHLAQLRDVLRGFWIPDLTRGELGTLALHYLTGLRVRDPWLGLVGVATAAATLGVLVARRDFGRGLILALVLLPWAGGLVFSILSGRTILLGRYLVFSHQYYLAAVALAIAEAPGRAARLVLAALALSGGLYATAREAESQRGRGKTLEPLARRIALERRPGQVVVTGELARALQLGYYLERLGVGAPVRIAGAPSTVGGHRVYLATVPDDAWVDGRDLGSLPYDWIWFVETDKSKPGPTPPRWRLVGSSPFIELHAPRMILHLYGRSVPERRPDRE